MIANRQSFYISPAEYLAMERVSPIKHEYRLGQVFAMSGAKNAHGMIITNLATLLNIHLQDTNCLILTSDTKVKIDEGNYYYYPDVVVTCDDAEVNSNDDFIVKPTLIIEVLSKSTEKFDREEKFNDYQRISTLEEYVLVNQTQMRVECWRKNAEENWAEQIYITGNTVEFISLDLRCQIEEIYRKVPGIELT